MSSFLKKKKKGTLSCCVAVCTCATWYRIKGRYNCCMPLLTGSELGFLFTKGVTHGSSSNLRPSPIQTIHGNKRFKKKEPNSGAEALYLQQFSRYPQKGRVTDFDFRLYILTNE